MEKYWIENEIEQCDYDQGEVKSKLMTQTDFENANSQKRCDICRLKHIKPEDEHNDGSKHLPRCSHTTTNWRLYKLAKEREIVKIKKENTHHKLKLAEKKEIVARVNPHRQAFWNLAVRKHMKDPPNAPGFDGSGNEHLPGWWSVLKEKFKEVDELEREHRKKVGKTLGPDDDKRVAAEQLAAGMERYPVGYKKMF